MGVVKIGAIKRSRKMSLGGSDVNRCGLELAAVLTRLGDGTNNGMVGAH